MEKRNKQVDDYIESLFGKPDWNRSVSKYGYRFTKVGPLTRVDKLIRH